MKGTLWQRFVVKFRPDEVTGCWLWTASCDGHGYGMIGHAGRVIRASRASWLLHYGPIPSGAWVLHRCDTPACVNPDHLFLGDVHANIADMCAKGRAYRPGGERHYAAKLTADAVATIRASSSPWRVLAQQYGVSKAAIWKVRQGRSWKGANDAT